MSEDQNVIKHSAAIQIANEITLLQRRTWNILLGNAYEHLLERKKHEISLTTLARLLGFDSKNNRYLKENLKALVKTTVEWNVLEKDKKYDWGISGLLADVRIRKNICYYSYGAFLKEMLYNPKMYAKISLSIQNQFKSKHTLALYELFVDYLDISRGEGETPFIDISTFRKMMGIKDGKYVEFKKLNKWVISDPIREINDKSNLIVAVEKKTEQRKVIAVKFVIKKKEDSSFSIKPLEFGKNSEQKEEILLTDEEKYIRKLRKRKISKGDAEKFVNQYDYEYLDSKLDYYDWIVEEVKAGRISENQAPRTGKWLKNCIEDDWCPPDSYISKKELKKEQSKQSLLNECRQLLKCSEYEKAKEKAERYLEDSSSEKATKIRDEAERLLAEQKLNLIAENYVKSLSSEQIETLHKETEDRMKKELTPSLFNFVMNQGRKGSVYKSKFFKVVIEHVETSRN